MAIKIWGASVESDERLKVWGADPQWFIACFVPRRGLVGFDGLSGYGMML